MLKTITAKFNSKCAISGKTLKRGETIIFDTNTRCAYHKDYAPKESTDESAYVEAQENEYFDSFCRNNGI